MVALAAGDVAAADQIIEIIAVASTPLSLGAGAVGAYYDGADGYFTFGAYAGALQATYALSRLALLLSRGACFAEGTAVQTAEGGEPIEEIEVGDRVRSLAVERESSVDRSWRVVELEVQVDTDSRQQLRLLRPVEWFERNRVSKPGDQIYLATSELGHSGWARIIAIEPAPPVVDGPGEIVTGTSRLISRDLYELVFDDSSRLRVTGAHPLYSSSRGDWVTVEELRDGESLQSEGRDVVVVAIDRVVGEHVVFNIETEFGHEYLVGDLGIRAHNRCSWLKMAMAHHELDEIPAWMRLVGSRAHGHHIIPKKGGGAIGRELREMAERNGFTDVWNDLDNVTVAPIGDGTHSHKMFRMVRDRLSDVDGLGEAAFRDALIDIGNEIREGVFHRAIGRVP